MAGALAECEPWLTDFQDDIAGDPQHDPSNVAGLELLRRQVREALASCPSLSALHMAREDVVRALEGFMLIRLTPTGARD